MIDLHVHLYGALKAESLWMLAQLSPRDPARIAWYKDEYEKINGRKSCFDKFFTNDRGFDYFKSEYTCEITQNGFDTFQAAINLPIALFPLSPDHDNPILKQVLNDDREAGFCRFIEYRVFLPPYFDHEKCMRYLTRLATQVRDADCGSFSPRLVMSLPRKEPDRSRLYVSLRTWQQQNTALSEFITGVDFCASERGQPPLLLQAFAQRLSADNIINPSQRLKLLVHVAETLEPAAPLSMVRWVHQAGQLGANRLGHCVALAVSAPSLVGEVFSESVNEYIDHLKWEVEQVDWLASVGYDVDIDNHQHLIGVAMAGDINTERKLKFAISDADRLSSLQEAVKKFLALTGTVIETCPTSNAIINRIADSTLYPCRTLLNDSRLKVVVGSDDPGIFQTTLEQEYSVCRAAGVNEEAIARSQQLAGQLVF